MVKTGL
jgi:DNA-binding LytR/AlgR family response regulator